MGGQGNAEAAHLNGLLDEALDETFPASDPPATLEPGGRASEAPAEVRLTPTPTWLVRAMWAEGDSETTKKFRIAAASIREAVVAVIALGPANAQRIEISALCLDGSHEQRARGN